MGNKRTKQAPGILIEPKENKKNYMETIPNKNTQVSYQGFWIGLFIWVSCYGLFLFYGPTIKLPFLLAFGLTATFCSWLCLMTLRLGYWISYEWPLRRAITVSYMFLAATVIFGYLMYDFLSSISMLLLCIFLGGLFGRYLKDWNLVFVMTCLIIIIDIISVFFGPANRIAGHDFFAYLVTVKFPVLGSETIPIIGFSDLIFIGIFFSICRRFDLEHRTTLLVMAAGLAGIIGLTCLTQQPLPALPFLSGGFFLIHRKHMLSRQFDTKKNLKLILAGAFCFIIFALIVEGIPHVQQEQEFSVSGDHEH